MKHTALLISLAIVTVSLTACASTDMYPEAKPDTFTGSTNTNPRHGWVEVQPYEDIDTREVVPLENNGIWKKCDGGTLIYMNIAFGPSTSIAVVPDSPECVG